jgi:hypothetical protein
MLVDMIHNKLSEKTNAFHSMIQDAIGSRFLETFLYCATDEIKTIYIRNNIVPNISLYSKHVYANYVIQTLLKTMDNSEGVLIFVFTKELSFLSFFSNL